MLKASIFGTFKKCSGAWWVSFCVPERNSRAKKISSHVFSSVFAPSFISFSLPNIEAFSEVVC